MLYSVITTAEKPFSHIWEFDISLPLAILFHIVMVNNIKMACFYFTSTLPALTVAKTIECTSY